MAIPAKNLAGKTVARNRKMMAKETVEITRNIMVRKTLNGTVKRMVGLKIRIGCRCFSDIIKNEVSSLKDNES